MPLIETKLYPIWNAGNAGSYIKNGVLRSRICKYKIARSGESTIERILDKLRKHYQKEHRRTS